MKDSHNTIAHSVHATLTIPGSKLMTTRALVLAALADGVSEISNLYINEEVRDLIKALHQLGIMIQLDEFDRTCIIGGCNGQIPRSEATIDFSAVHESIYFLLVVCASMPGIYHFESKMLISDSKLEMSLKTLIQQGADILSPQPLKIPFTIKGTDGIAGGEMEFHNTPMEALISGLLLAGPFAKTPLSLMTHDLHEASIELTCSLMSEFGALVRRMHQFRYAVPVPQRYRAKDYIIEPDLELAAYFFAAAAMTKGKITIQSFNREYSRQSEAVFLLYLEKMGCEIIETESHLTLLGPIQLKSINIDMRFFSGPIFALIALVPFASSMMTITNISACMNSVLHMCSELEKIGVKTEHGPDWVKIFPSLVNPGILDAQNNAYIAMAFFIMSLRCKGIKLKDPECIVKVYPEFFELWEEIQAPDQAS